MTHSSLIAIVSLAIVLLLMIAEAIHAARNERALLARGAAEPAGDVYKTMRWVYPLCFGAMAFEGAMHEALSPTLLRVGLVVFVLAKALKYWAITTLGPRWTFRVLVLPSAPLVAEGPYSFLRHPNYVAVVGELIGAALVLSAPVTGALALAAFGWLMRRRIAVEDRALGRSV
jgi:methyltransferase